MSTFSFFILAPLPPRRAPARSLRAVNTPLARPAHWFRRLPGSLRTDKSETHTNRSHEPPSPGSHGALLSVCARANHMRQTAVTDSRAVPSSSLLSHRATA